MARNVPRASRQLPVASLVAVAASIGTSAFAQDATPVAVAELMDVAIVSGDTPSQGEGRIAVNIASGNGNQQLGTLVVANGQMAAGASAVHQHQGGTSGDGATFAVIESGAFAGMRGAISVNVAAGSANQEANIAIIATGLEGRTASDLLLSQTRSSAQPVGGPIQPSAPNDVAKLAPDAFEGSQGLIQVNLIGGERNSSANTFALNVSAGGNP
jgi:hypothetical protein